jgi:hypothetical protein
VLGKGKKPPKLLLVPGPPQTLKPNA